MIRPSAIFALLTAGLCWGTTGIYVRILGERGFSSFELLAIRLLVVFIILVPIILLPKIRRSSSIVGLSVAQRNVALRVSLLMLFYYLGAILAIQHLPLILAVLLFGSSPLIAWSLELILSRRLPDNTERVQSLGVLLGTLGLLGLAYTRHSGSMAPAGAVPIVGYAGGITAAMVTVVNARILRRAGLAAPPSISISLITSILGAVLMPILFIESVGLFDRIKDSWFALLGFGVVATLIPGFAIVYAGSRLPTAVTSTVSIQLQVWTVILGWLILDETMSVSQITAAISVMLGTAICLLPPQGTGRSSP